MSNETMRIFFPLKITTYHESEYGYDESPEEISPAQAVAYEDAILAAIAKENRSFRNDRGLAEYIHDESLNKKVHSLYPSVEIVDGELWGVMTAGLTESLSGEETADLLDFVSGQNSDGYGEGFEQRPINTPDGEIYVSFWDSGEHYFVKPEIKNSSPDPEEMKKTQDSNKLQAAYIDKLNKDILPHLDFKKLHESCNADLQYAKDVLKSLHDAFVDVYQTDTLSDRDFEFVLVPAVIQAEKTGNLSLGILTLDIASSGEHWGTIFFTDQGLIDGNDPNLPSAGKDYIRANYIPYQYWYTVDLERDHHVDFENMPENVREILDCCQPENSLQMDRQQYR